MNSNEPISISTHSHFIFFFFFKKKSLFIISARVKWTRLLLNYALDLIFFPSWCAYRPNGTQSGKGKKKKVRDSIQSTNEATDTQLLLDPLHSWLGPFQVLHRVTIVGWLLLRIVVVAFVSFGRLMGGSFLFLRVQCQEERKQQQQQKEVDERWTKQQMAWNPLSD